MRTSTQTCALSSSALYKFESFLACDLLAVDVILVPDKAVISAFHACIGPALHDLVAESRSGHKINFIFGTAEAHFAKYYAVSGQLIGASSRYILEILLIKLLVFICLIAFILHHDSLLSDHYSHSIVETEWDNSQQEYNIIKTSIQARIDQNISQAELARRTGIDQSNISKIERGANSPFSFFTKKTSRWNEYGRN